MWPMCSKLPVWFYPSAVYVDRDLLAITLMEKDARLVLGLESYFAYAISGGMLRDCTHHVAYV